MNLKHYLLSVSILFLGLCILVGSWFISDAIKSNQKFSNITTTNELLTEKEAADYLRMDEFDFNQLISNQNRVKSQQSVYDTYKYIPFMILNGKRYYSQEQIDKWIEYNMLNK